MERPLDPNQMVDRLLGTLRSLPNTTAELVVPETAAPGEQLAGHHAIIDAIIDLRIGGQSTKLLVELKRDVFPRDVHRLVHQLKAYRNQLGHAPDQPPSLLSLIAAVAISPGAKDELKKEGIGYFDSGGSLFIPASSALVLFDKPTPKTITRVIRNLFSGTRQRVAHALLMLPRDDWHGVKDLAGAAHVSPATVSEVMHEMERLGWLRARGEGPAKKRILEEPGALLDAWVDQLKHLRQGSLRRYFVPVLTSQLEAQVEQTFAKNLATYAITHEAAAQRYSAFLTHVSQLHCRLAIGTEVNRALRDLDLKPVTEGANLIIHETQREDALLFRQRIDNLWLASPVQVYLDLVRSEGRAKEMADHLRRHVIKA